MDDIKKKQMKTVNDIRRYVREETLKVSRMQIVANIAKIRAYDAELGAISERQLKLIDALPQAKNATQADINAHIEKFLAATSDLLTRLEQAEKKTRKHRAG